MPTEPREPTGPPPESPPTQQDLQLRPATRADLSAVADVHLAARAAAVPQMPPAMHPDDEVRAWIAGWDLERRETWVAVESGAVSGYAVVEGDWLDSLYVDPRHRGRGVGSALLGLVKALRPRGFALWVFESNRRARALYARHGLVELEHTDGETNDERSPDLRAAWLGEDPLGFLRTQVDQVDDALALLFARRAALTAEIQRHKPVPGRAGRDPGREAEIAARMARRAPGVGLAGFTRIMGTVIDVSLDVAEPEPD